MSNVFWRAQKDKNPKLQKSEKKKWIEKATLSLSISKQDTREDVAHFILDDDDDDDDDESASVFFSFLFLFSSSSVFETKE